MGPFEVHLPIADMEFSALVLAGLGFAVGVLAGFFGMGGGWVMTPALNAMGFPMPMAIGTGLASIAGQSALATVKHRKMGTLSVRLGAIVGVSMIAGVEAGARVVMRLESLGLADTVVRWVYVMLLSALAVHMIRDVWRGARRRAGGDAGAPDSAALVARLGVLRLPPTMTLRSCGVRLSLWVPVTLGLAVGFLAGLMGTGGGFALVPAFIYVIGTPTVVAVGTSLQCVLISGAYGAFSYALKGRMDPFAAGWMLLGAAGGVQLGAAAVRHVRGSGIRLLYGLMLVVAAGGVLMKQFGHVAAARACILGGAGALCVVIVGRMVACKFFSGRQGTAE